MSGNRIVIGIGDIVYYQGLKCKVISFSKKRVRIKTVPGQWMGVGVKPIEYSVKSESIKHDCGCGCIAPGEMVDEVFAQSQDKEGKE